MPSRSACRLRRSPRPSRSTMGTAPCGCRRTCFRPSATSSARIPTNASTSLAGSSSTQTGQAAEVAFRPQPTTFSSSSRQIEEPASQTREAGSDFFKPDEATNQWRSSALLLNPLPGIVRVHANNGDSHQSRQCSRRANIRDQPLHSLNDRGLLLFLGYIGVVQEELVLFVTCDGPVVCEQCQEQSG